MRRARVVAVEEEDGVAAEEEVEEVVVGEVAGGILLEMNER
jgi:hypothetical protein